MLGVHGKWEAEVGIGGISIGPDPQRTPVIEMRAGVQRALPSLYLEFFDRNAEVTESLGGVKDGTPISVSLGDGKGGPITSASFVSMGNPEVSLAKQGLNIKINGVLQNIGWMRKVVDFHLPQAPSSAMIAAMAGLAGLAPDVDMTSDIQTWLPNRQPLVKYAEMVMQRAHSGSGAMIMATTLDGRLRYKVLSRLIGMGGVTLGGPQKSDGIIPYVDWATQATGAVQNATAGYGITSLAEGITGMLDELGKVDIPFPGGDFGIGLGSIEAMGSYGTRILSMGVDGGNCQVGGTLVPTNRGLLRLDEIANRSNGDSQSINLVVGSICKPHAAKKWYYSGKHPTLKIVVATGNQVHCTANHPNLVLDETTGETVWKKATDCRIGEFMCINPMQPRRTTPLIFNLEDPPHKTLDGNTWNEILKPVEMTPDLAAFMAFVVAEGGISQRHITFHNTSKKIVNRYVHLAKKLFDVSPSVSFTERDRCFKVSIGSVALVSYMKQLGCRGKIHTRGAHPAYYKEVPWSILQADENSQLSFLGAYLDGDGTIDNSSGRIVWYSASKKIVEQLQILLNTHGVCPIISQCRSQIYGNVVQRLSISGADSSRIWPSLKPYVLTKKLKTKTRREIANGIPSGYWKALVEERRIRDGKPRKSTFYINDNGDEVQVQWDWLGKGRHQARLFINEKFSYADYESGSLDSMLDNIRLISEMGYKKLIALFERRYFFSPIVSKRSAGTHDVYDLSMANGEEPAFIANGLIVHNTHDNYYKAQHANIKEKSAWTNDVSVLTPYATGLDVLDGCAFRAFKPVTMDEMSAYSGRYVVTNVVKGFRGGNYFEKLTITNTSP
jgi:intein/homing endonuclease